MRWLGGTLIDRLGFKRSPEAERFGLTTMQRSGGCDASKRPGSATTKEDPLMAAAHLYPVRSTATPASRMPAGS